MPSVWVCVCVGVACMCMHLTEGVCRCGHVCGCALGGGWMEVWVDSTGPHPEACTQVTAGVGSKT